MPTGLAIVHWIRYINTIKNIIESLVSIERRFLYGEVVSYSHREL